MAPSTFLRSTVQGSAKDPRQHAWRNIAEPVRIPEAGLQPLPRKEGLIASFTGDGRTPSRMTPVVHAPHRVRRSSASFLSSVAPSRMPVMTILTASLGNSRRFSTTLAPKLVRSMAMGSNG